MKTAITLFSFGLLILALTPAARATDVSGPVTGIWSSANNPYNVIGEIYVPANQNLTILPGVMVVFQGHYKFRVDSNATLKAKGMPGDSILFSVPRCFKWVSPD